MADKKFPLSIVLQTVDNATSGINRLKARLDKLAVNQIGEKLTGKKGLGEALGKLGESAGVERVLGGFSRVGGALTSIVSKFATLGVVAAGAGVAAAGALKGIVDEFDNIGDAADKIGIAPQVLGELHFAAKVAGASMEDLDAGLLSFSKNLGMARAGNKGKLAGFLEEVSPVLLKQVKKAKGPEQAIDLIANAMGKLQDPAKRTALAVAAFGGSGAQLVPLLTSGSKGLDEMRARFRGLAGDIGPAAEIAGEIDNDFHDLGAATMGVKAAILSGVGPALSKLIAQMTKFIAEHREDIAKWAKDLGDKIPGAIDAVGTAFNDIVAVIKPVWEDMGGLRTAATLLAAVITGKLVVSIGLLSVALATTPFGWAVLAVGALVAAGTALVLNWDKVGKFFTTLWDGIKKTFADAWDFISGIVDGIVAKVQAAIDFLTGHSLTKLIGTDAADAKREARENGSLLLGPQGDEPGVGILPPNSNTQAKITIDMKNVPKGTRVSLDPESTAIVDVNVGQQMSF